MVGGRRQFFQEFINTTASLVCSGGVRGHAHPPPPRKKKCEASNEVFWIIFRPVFFLPIHVTVFGKLATIVMHTVNTIH